MRPCLLLGPQRLPLPQGLGRWRRHARHPLQRDLTVRAPSRLGHPGCHHGSTLARARHVRPAAQVHKWSAPVHGQCPVRVRLRGGGRRPARGHPLPKGRVTSSALRTKCCLNGLSGNRLSACSWVTSSRSKRWPPLAIVIAVRCSSPSSSSSTVRPGRADEPQPTGPRRGGAVHTVWHQCVVVERAVPTPWAGRGERGAATWALPPYPAASSTPGTTASSAAPITCAAEWATSPCTTSPPSRSGSRFTALAPGSSGRCKSHMLPSTRAHASPDSERPSPRATSAGDVMPAASNSSPPSTQRRPLIDAGSTALAACCNCSKRSSRLAAASPSRRRAGVASEGRAVALNRARMRNGTFSCAMLLALGFPLLARTTGPCDIYGAAKTPCVAAHSTVRPLYAGFKGGPPVSVGTAGRR